MRLRVAVRGVTGRLAAPAHPLLGRRGGDPVLRQVERAMTFIREHYGEERQKRQRRLALDVRAVGAGEAFALQRSIRGESPEAIGVGDKFTLGDPVEWHVVEARKAGAGRYVLVVER